MREIFDKGAPKKATHLSVNGGLPAEARNLKVNLSATLARALEQEVRQNRRPKSCPIAEIGGEKYALVTHQMLPIKLRRSRPHFSREKKVRCC